MSPLGTLPVLAQRRTASDEVADALRVAIVSGHFEDDEELNQVELARHFGVSRVPVREALRRLEAEGLVSAEAHRRVVVPGLNRARISEIFEMRALLEAFMLERSARELGEPQLAELRDLCDTMDSAPVREAWLDLNHAFHQLMLLPADATIAMALVDRLASQVERYLRRTGGVHRPQDAGLEHRLILEALESGAPKKAARLLSKHILGTRDRVLAALPADPVQP